MIEKIKECIASGDLVLVGIGDECSLKHHTKEELQTFYEKLADLLKEKEYFIVTLNTDDLIWDSSLKDEKMVAPCGSDLTENTVTSEHYDESWYLPQWEAYTKWVQNTLHQKLTVLELGVGFAYPQVVRWPFEKTVYFNKKAELVRVHSKFAQVPPELTERSITLSKDPVLLLNCG